MEIKEEKACKEEFCKRSWEENAFKRINYILGEITSDTDDNSIGKVRKLQSEESASFFERLSTFNSFSWSLKPLRLSPPLCARLGWKVTKPHALECVGCHKVLSAELPPVSNSDLYAKTVLKLEKALKDSHEKYCHWPLKNCPENYLYEILLQRDKSAVDYKRRLRSLCKSILPKLAKDIPDDLKLCCQKLQSSNVEFLRAEDDEQQSCSDEAVILAVTGWSNVISNNVLPLIKCDHCLRTIDASLYREEPHNVDKDDNLDEPDTKKSYKYVHTLFHPLNDHHKWCPWIAIMTTGAPQSSSGKPCWMILCNTLLSYNQVTPESPRNVVLKVKGIISKWIK